MTDDKENKMIEMFFDENKIDIADDGFSRRVMQGIGNRTWRYNRNWTVVCIVIGVLFLFFRYNLSSFFSSDWKSIIGDLIGSLSDFATQSSLLLMPGTYVLAILSLVVFGGYKLITEE